VGGVLCNIASCWIDFGILLGAHPILHISRKRVKLYYKLILVVLEVKWLLVSDGEAKEKTRCFKTSGSQGLCCVKRVTLP
jgi:hypothetical protein